MTDHLDDRTDPGDYDIHRSIVSISHNVGILARWVRGAIVAGFAIYALRTIHQWMQ
jgi:hypothetical protein